MLSQEGGLHVDEHCWTLDKPMTSFSICQLGLWLGWQILFNLAVASVFYDDLSLFMQVSPKDVVRSVFDIVSLFVQVRYN